MWSNTLLCSECFVIFDWYHSPCLSWDPSNVDDLGRVALFGNAGTILVLELVAPAPSNPSATSPCMSPSLGTSKVGCEPCLTCGHEVESDAAKALECVRKLWSQRGIGITSSSPPPPFFVCHVVRCSELVVLGLGVMLVH